jgi:tetratricopeptide (TPR) repeat protein
MSIAFIVCLSIALDGRPLTPGPVTTQGRVTQGPVTQGPGTRDPAAEAPYYFLLGRYLEGEGKVDEAVASFRKAIALDPTSAEPRAELAALYARQDKTREAVDAAEDALKVDPKNREANRVLGTVLAAFAEQRQRVHPGDDVATYPKRAIAALEIARGDGTGDLSIDLTLARLYLDQDRPADAVPLLRRIVTEQPQYADGSLLLAEAQEASGSPDTALETLKSLLQDQPQFFRGQVQLAEVYERQRRWSDAAAAWASAQALNPKNPEIPPHRANALVNAGRSADAVGVVREALAKAPNDVRLSFLMAQAQRDTGDLDGAVSTARSLRAAHPEDVRAAYLLGQMLEAKGRHQEVIDLLQPEIARLRAANVKGAQLAMLLATEGSALLQLRRNDEAMTLLKDAVAQAPDDTAVLFQYGAALDRGGNPAEAERAFRDVIARDPLDAGALNYLGYMLAEHGTSLDEAVSLIERALKVDPDNPSYLDSLGWAYVQQGKLDLAEQPLSTAADRLPKNSVIQDHLGDLRLKQNRRTDAIAAWERALAGDMESLDRAKLLKKIEAARKLR